MAKPKKNLAISDQTMELLTRKSETSGIVAEALANKLLGDALPKVKSLEEINILKVEGDDD